MYTVQQTYRIHYIAYNKHTYLHILYDRMFTISIHTYVQYTIEYIQYTYIICSKYTYSTAYVELNVKFLSLPRSYLTAHIRTE